MKKWKTRESLFCIKIKSPDILLHIYEIWPVRHEFIYKPIFLWSMLTFVWCVLIRRLLVGILLGMILCNAAETFLMICISKIMFEHSFSHCMKCPNTELFLVRIFMYSVQIQENTDQKKLRIWKFSAQYSFFVQCICKDYLLTRKTGNSVKFF